MSENYSPAEYVELFSNHRDDFEWSKLGPPHQYAGIPYDPAWGEGYVFTALDQDRPNPEVIEVSIRRLSDGGSAFSGRRLHAFMSTELPSEARAKLLEFWENLRRNAPLAMLRSIVLERSPLLEPEA